MPICPDCNVNKIKNTTKRCKSCHFSPENLKALIVNYKGADPTLKEITYVKHHRSSTFAFVRSRARSLYNRRYTTCQFCGYSKHVEIAHIKPISSFPDDTPLSIINATDNILPLCPNCHWEFDHGKKDLQGNDITPQTTKKEKIIKFKIKWPPTETLLTCLQYCPRVQLASLLGVSDNAIKKHLAKRTKQKITKLTTNLELVKELLKNSK